MNSDIGDGIKKIINATIKGSISEIPLFGSLFAEYYGLVQSNIEDKRMNKWKDMMEEKLQILQEQQYSIKQLSTDELFYSCIRIATVDAMNCYQEEKRLLFANTIYNAAVLDIDADKKMLFLSLLDKCTLIEINLLQYYAESHYHKSEQSSSIISINIGRTEEPIKSILENHPEYKNDIYYVKMLSEHLISYGLVYFFDFENPESPEKARRKRTSQLGDEFLSYIATVK